MMIIFSQEENRLLFSGEGVKQEVIALLTKQVVSGQGVEDARGPDEVAHGSGDGGGVNADGDEGVPDVDVSEETVVVLQEGAVGENAPDQYFNSTTRRVSQEYKVQKCFILSSYPNMDSNVSIILILKWKDKIIRTFFSMTERKKPSSPFL